MEGAFFIHLSFTLTYFDLYYHRGGPILTNMDDGGDNDASPRPFSNKTIAKWAFGIFLIMLLLILFIGTTNAGEPILPLLIGDWLFKVILFVIISLIYGLQYWVKGEKQY
jgi:uncharacterized membrane protein YtjA (UPF0391 family)